MLRLKTNKAFAYLKKYFIKLCTLYIAAALMIYFVSFNAICYNNDKGIQTNMKQILSEITLDINNELAKYTVSTRILSKDNAIKRTVDFKMNSQLEAYCSKLVYDQSLKNLVVTDIYGKVLFDSNNIFTYIPGNESTVNYAIVEKEYNTFLKKESLYFSSYFPLLNDRNKLCGSISSFYSMDDFNGLFSKRLTGTPYVIYTVFENSPANFYIGSNRAKNHMEEESMKYSFFCRTNESMVDFISTFVSENISGSGIAIGIPSSLYGDMQKENMVRALIWTIFHLFVISIILLLWIYLRSRVKLESEIEQLRMEKHDFIKHVNIVNSLAYNSDLPVLKEYIAALGENLSMKNSLNMLGNSAISILLGNKEAQSREKGIKFELLVKTSIDKIHVNVHELCSMIENLIDNALEACEKVPEGNRYVEVEISHTPGNYVIRVMNTGDILERNINKIFEYGYTTKGNNQEHGMGLFIVSNIVNKYKGSITVDCEGGKVSFAVYLPS